MRLPSNGLKLGNSPNLESETIMTEVFGNLAFDPAVYQADLRSAGNAWRTAEGRADTFARSTLAALVTDSLSAMAVALTVYDEMSPKTAKGKLAEPKESDKAPGGVSVSTLRSAKGGEGARSALEAIFYVSDNRALDSEAVASFIRNDKSALKLFALKAHLGKLKMDMAKAEAEAALPPAGADVEAKEGEAEAVVPAIVGELTAMAAKIAGLSGEELAAASGALAALIEAARDAAARLAAADALEIEAREAA